LLSKTEKQGPT